TIYALQPHQRGIFQRYFHSFWVTASFYCGKYTQCNIKKIDLINILATDNVALQFSRLVERLELYYLAACKNKR
ncbi:hypothetical protein QLF84_23795, partial [Salmonella enterica subsp. enterica serovar Oslo]|uniref:hypothetical protein n=1 Tax=Salmonella enterica TaxID=28901 RepID=UPI002891331F